VAQKVALLSGNASQNHGIDHILYGMYVNKHLPLIIIIQRTST